MTENRRIVLNVLASYARSMFSILCAIYTSRWVLHGMGEIDYGLFGVVGSLLAFIAFVNSMMSMGSARFYSISLGNQRTAADKAQALDECRRWFSFAVMIHTAMAVLFVAVGYPIGVWMVGNVLNIPPDRVADSITAFRFSCVACFIGMITLPYSAMYTAKQEIAEVTFFSVAVTIFMVVLSFCMVTHPGDWLVRFAAWTCASASIPCIYYAVRGRMRFPECRFRWKTFHEIGKLKEMLSFISWAFVGPLGILVRTQGMMILFNFLFGATVNASLSMARNLSEKSNTLASSVKGAMAPAVVQAFGAGDMLRMRGLVFRMCRLSLVATMLFAIPLLIEMPSVLRIWLDNPPPYLTGFAVCAILDYVAMVATSGYDTAVYAVGRLRLYQTVSALFSFASLPLMYIVYRCGGGVYDMSVAALLLVVGFSTVRVIIASRMIGMSAVEWFNRLALPVVGASILAAGMGVVPVLMLPESVFRLLIVVLIGSGSFCMLAWKYVLDRDERDIVLRKFDRFRSVF